METCPACKKEFSFADVNLKYKNNKGYTCKCPHCKERLVKNKEIGYEYKTLDNGQIVRKSPKIKQSKKQRLKNRRLLQERLLMVEKQKEKGSNDV